MLDRLFFRPLYGYVTAYFSVAVQYRSGIAVTTLGGIIGLFITYNLWSAIVAFEPQIGAMSGDEATQRVLLGQILLPVLTFGLENVVGQHVRTGGLAIEMARPVDYQVVLLGQSLGRMLGLFLNRALPLFLISVAFFRLPFPAPRAAAALVLSLTLSFLLNFLIAFLFSILTLYTLNTWGLLSARILCASFFSGALVPTDLFPETLRTIVSYLPFRSAGEIPILIYRGADGVAGLLGYQALWLIALFLFSRIVFMSLRRRVLIQGG